MRQSESGGGKKRQRRRRSAGLVDYMWMKALSSRLRVEILAIFCERIASPKEITRELEGNLSQISYHVGVLKACGLITLDHKVPRRGAIEHFYRAAEPTLIPAGTWNRLPAAVRSALSAKIVEHFFEDASASAQAGLFEERPAELCWTPLVLDAKGLDELEQLTHAFIDGLLEVQANASARLPRGKRGLAAARSATVFLSSFLAARKPKDAQKASSMKRR